MHEIAQKLNPCIHVFNKNIDHCLLWNTHIVGHGRNRLGGNSMVVQRLGLHVSITGDTGSIPGQATNIPHAVMQPKNNKFKFKKKRKTWNML